MDIAKSVSEAMDLLKASAEEEEIEEEAGLEADSDEGTEEIEEPVDKGMEIGIIKGQDTEVLDQYIQADTFMRELVELTDSNMTRMSKAVDANRMATASVLTILKALGDKLDVLSAAVDSTPQPRRSALTKAEAEATVIDNPAVSNDGAEPLTKGAVVQAITKAVGEGKAEARDVVMLESLGGGFSTEVALDVVVSKLSPGGQQVVRSLSGR